MDFSIKDTVHMVGFTPHTLRYYESIGLLPEAERTSGNYRLFNVTDIIDLIRIKRLTGLGFDLRHMRQVMDDPTNPGVTAVLGAQRRVLTQQIDGLQEKRAKIEEIQDAQAPLNVTIEFADLERAWADVQSGLDVEDWLKFEIELLATFANDPDRLKCEKPTRIFIEKHDDPGFRKLRELDTRLEALEPDASPKEIAVLVDDYIRILDPIRARFAPTSEKTLVLTPTMEKFTYSEAQLTVVTNARKHLQSSDGESPDPSQTPK